MADLTSMLEHLKHNQESISDSACFFNGTDKLEESTATVAGIFQALQSLDCQFNGFVAQQRQQNLKKCLKNLYGAQYGKIVTRLSQALSLTWRKIS